jgi:hypothetical protein
MSNQALFISPNYIKETTVIDGNVDEKYIKILAYDCQLKYVLPILGTALFDEISDQITAGSLTPSTTSNNSTLLKNYIQPALKHWILYEGMDVFNYKVTNKAVVTKNSDNSQAVEQVDIIRLMDKARENAEFFSQRLTNYLEANTSTFPLYLNPGTSCDTVVPKRNNYTTGWNLDDDNNNGYGLPIDWGRCNY